MKFRPLRDRIAVKPVERVKSNIIEVVMDEVTNMGTVVAVGPEAAKNGIEIDQFIRFGTMGNDEYLKYPEYWEDNEKYLIMSWKDVAFIQD